MVDGPTTSGKRFGKMFGGTTILLAAQVKYLPITAKDKSLADQL